jgi:hypothetical protein
LFAIKATQQNTSHFEHVKQQPQVEVESEVVCTTIAAAAAAAAISF